MASSTAPYTTDFANSKDTFQAAHMSLFSGKPEDTETDLAKLCTPTFTIRAPDIALDFHGFVAHICRLRQILPSVTLTITQFLRDGTQLAERHDSTTIHSDGSAREAETFLFAEIADDGRLAWIVENVRRC